MSDPTSAPPPVAVETASATTTLRPRWRCLLDDPAARRIIVFFLLAAALVLGVGLRADLLRVKHGLHVDEAWSYATASGHLSALAGNGTAALRGKWVVAEQWKRLWQPGENLDFGRIRSDLGSIDVHPPLYFWLLRVWIAFFGVNFWSGPLLNVIVDICTGVALFGLARHLLRSSISAALIVLMWSVSPAVRVTSSMARMYPLLALCTVLFAWALLAATDRDRPPRRSLTALVLLSLATAGGVLTQYEFVTFVAGAALFAIVRLARVERRRCFQTLAALGVGLILTIAVQPAIFTQFSRQLQKPQMPYSRGALVSKINGAVYTVYQFFGLGGRWLRNAVDGPVRLGGLVPGPRVSSLVLLTFWIGVAFVAVFALPGFRRWLRSRDTTGYVALVFLVWVTAAIMVPNLSFHSQPRILSARYLAAAFPFFAFVPVLVFRALLPRVGSVLTAVFCLAFVVPATFGPTNYASSFGSLQMLAGARRAVFECVGPGVLPRAMWHISDESPVYVDSWKALRAAPASWLDDLSLGDYFVYRPCGHPSALSTLRTRYSLTELRPPCDNIHIYRVGPALPAPEASLPEE